MGLRFVNHKCINASYCISNIYCAYNATKIFTIQYVALRFAGIYLHINFVCKLIYTEVYSVLMKFMLLKCDETLSRVFDIFSLRPTFGIF